MAKTDKDKPTKAANDVAIGDGSGVSLPPIDEVARLAEGTYALQEGEAVAFPAIHAVRLDRPGVLRCGPYEAGKVYRVDGETLTNAEAHRLVKHKGFTEINEEV